MFGDLIILLVMFVLNGFFSLSEMAVVSSRRNRLQAMLTKAHETGAQTTGIETALRLQAEPGRFLSSVQIGITLIGVLAGAFGGATLSAPLAKTLIQIPTIGPYAAEGSFVFVVVVITYLSLIIGELVPKRIALSNPEAIASFISRPMTAFAKALSPIVTLVSKSTEGVLSIYGFTGANVQKVTEDEIRHLIAEGAASGAIEQAEGEIANRVLQLGDMRVSEIMTPRINVVWLDRDAPIDETREIIYLTQNMRYPVRCRDTGRAIGMVRIEDLFVEKMDEESIFEKMVEPLFIPRTSSVLKAMSVLQSENKFMAFIIDEYGEIDGTVSMSEVFFAIIGDVSAHAQTANPAILKREDGSYLIDGVVSVEEIRRLLKLKNLPGHNSGEINTLAGVMLHSFDRLPNEGDYFAWNGYRFEVIDMDGPRIDKVMVVPAQNLPIGAFLDGAETGRAAE